MQIQSNLCHIAVLTVCFEITFSRCFDAILCLSIIHGIENEVAVLRHDAFAWLNVRQKFLNSFSENRSEKRKFFKSRTTEENFVVFVSLLKIEKNVAIFVNIEFFSLIFENRISSVGENIDRRSVTEHRSTIGRLAIESDGRITQRLDFDVRNFPETRFRIASIGWKRKSFVFIEFGLSCRRTRFCVGRTLTFVIQRFEFRYSERKKKFHCENLVFLFRRTEFRPENWWRDFRPNGKPSRVCLRDE